MTTCNNICPPTAEASRLLPVIGQVRPDGRIVLQAGDPPQLNPAPGAITFPNDPREA